MEPRNREDAAKAALGQIERQRYEAALVERGIPEEKIRKYAFAFEDKRVLIEKSKRKHERKHIES